MKNNKKTIIGKIEFVTLLDLNIDNLEVKIDTGADNCSIHAKILEIKDGFISFKLLDKKHHLYNKKTYVEKIHKERFIKSSNGNSEKRYFIKTKIKLGKKEINCFVSISDRSKMEYPMLLGNNFLKFNFLIDVTKKHLSKED